MTYYAPTRQFIDASERAIARDLRDAERLAALDTMVCRWIDALAPLSHPLENPEMRWHPGELVDALRGELNNIRGETERLRGPLVIEDY